MAVDIDGEVQFDGEGDYVEHRRHKSIFDARETARDVILNAKRQHSRGEISGESLRADARTAVEMYILEIEQMASMPEVKDQRSDEPLYTVVIQPPEQIVHYYRTESHRALSEAPKAQIPENGVIGSIQEFVDAPDVFSASWSVQVDVKHEGPQRVSGTSSTHMPVEASLNAFRAVNKFLQRSGLDIKPELPDYTGGDGPGL